MLFSRVTAAEGDCAGFKVMEYNTPDCSDEGTDKTSEIPATEKCANVPGTPDFSKLICDKTSANMWVYRDAECKDKIMEDPVI